MTLRVVPITLKRANAFVTEVHRHHGPTVGHKFSVGVANESGLCGVAIAGRPKARMLDDGEHIEVLRVATDGTANACSALYGAIRRAAIALGYRPANIITYTLASESGASLLASGWKRDAGSAGGSWSRPSRERDDTHPLEPKVRWHA